MLALPRCLQSHKRHPAHHWSCRASLGAQQSGQSGSGAKCRTVCKPIALLRLVIASARLEVVLRPLPRLPARAPAGPKGGGPASAGRLAEAVGADAGTPAASVAALTARQGLMGAAVAAGAAALSLAGVLTKAAMSGA